MEKAGLTETMRALVLVSPRSLEVRQEPMAVAGPEELILEVGVLTARSHAAACDPSAWLGVINVFTRDTIGEMWACVTVVLFCMSRVKENLRKDVMVEHS